MLKPELVWKLVLNLQTKTLTSLWAKILSKYLFFQNNDTCILCRWFQGANNYRILHSHNPIYTVNYCYFKSKTSDIYRESNHKPFFLMRAWKQLSNTISVTSDQ